MQQRGSIARVVHDDGHHGCQLGHGTMGECAHKHHIHARIYRHGYGNNLLCNFATIAREFQVGGGWLRTFLLCRNEYTRRMCEFCQFNELWDKDEPQDECAEWRGRNVKRFFPASLRRLAAVVVAGRRGGRSELTGVEAKQNRIHTIFHVPILLYLTQKFPLWFSSDISLSHQHILKFFWPTLQTQTVFMFKFCFYLLGYLVGLVGLVSCLLIIRPAEVNSLLARSKQRNIVRFEFCVSMCPRKYTYYKCCTSTLACCRCGFKTGVRNVPVRLTH